MKDTIRTFIAIKIAPQKEFLELISVLKRKLGNETIKWVEENNYHLTLRFLGETNPLQMEKISDFVVEICQFVAPFYFEIKGLGFFESRKNPKVLFVGIEPNIQLKKLATEIEKQAVVLGFKSSEKEYKPHLTLGRIKYLKNKSNFNSLVQQYAEIQLQQVNVSEIIFYESILSSGTPVYKPIKIVKLK